MANDWTAVIPVKPLAAAKSRLRGAVPGERHGELALAMVRDTAAAVLACPAVARLLVVTDDPDVTAAVTALGAQAVPDEPRAGLNAALAYGADVAAGLGVRRVALAGDLPALRPDEIASVLAAAGSAMALAAPSAQAAASGGRAPTSGSRRAATGGRAFVPDAEGVGTVLLTAAPGTPLAPRFGPNSAAAHAASGARPLTADWPGLRHDVDTAAGLADVLALGVGAHTRRVLAEIGAGGRRVAEAR